MNKELANELLEKLANGDLSELHVTKEDFLSFREQLVKRRDFKHFKGIAKHEGLTTYVYLSEARSWSGERGPLIRKVRGPLY